MKAYAGDNGIATSSRGRLEHAEEGDTRGLRFGGLINVELHGAFPSPRLPDAKVAGAERLAIAGSLKSWNGLLLAVINDDELLRSILRMGHPPVLVERAKVALRSSISTTGLARPAKGLGSRIRCNLLLLLESKVGKLLVSEDKATTLSAEKCHLIQASIGKFRLRKETR